MRLTVTFIIAALAAFSPSAVSATVPGPDDSVPVTVEPEPTVPATTVPLSTTIPPVATPPATTIPAPTTTVEAMDPNCDHWNFDPQPCVGGPNDPTCDHSNFPPYGCVETAEQPPPSSNRSALPATGQQTTRLLIVAGLLVAVGAFVSGRARRLN